MLDASTHSRRRFLQSSAAAVVSIGAANIWTSKRTAAQNVIGEGDHTFHFNHQWAQLPDKYHWQITHNVAVDPDNNVYVIHEGNAKLAEHPSIFVFDESGKFIRAFGQQFQGGGHGIEVHLEDGTPYLYVTGYQQTKTIAKMSLDGELVWQKYAPMQAGAYAADEASNPSQIWGRDRFMPTNFAFLNDEFLVADGYGSFRIHRYDFDGNWKSCFGGPGGGKGRFNTPHGIWVDRRGDGDPEIVICDRANNTLQTFSVDGQYRKTVPGFGLPANADTYGEWMVIPELVSQVSLLDQHHNVVVKLGSDQERILADQKANNGFTIRTDESKWEDGKFVHPHDACFDKQGDLYVAEWVSTGRVTKLTRA
ncbi:hypothetical protein [Rhodopirellula halodulae]|uniref:hypothetical protein n=1 Tax=Rhodopirellula halodulae TaxID=2894198 RepID=UPI001E655856|nr:hypothetical protein [Rhodopirellula sp. JC737]